MYKKKKLMLVLGFFFFSRVNASFLKITMIFLTIMGQSVCTWEGVIDLFLEP